MRISDLLCIKEGTSHNATLACDRVHARRGVRTWEQLPEHVRTADRRCWTQGRPIYDNNTHCTLEPRAQHHHDISDELFSKCRSVRGQEILHDECNWQRRELGEHWLVEHVPRAQDCIDKLGLHSWALHGRELRSKRRGKRVGAQNVAAWVVVTPLRLARHLTRTLVRVHVRLARVRKHL
jgi:hypothetical protein